MDADPFGLSYRSVAGPYSLHQFESGKYYIEGPGGTEGSGVVGGIVERIAWTKTHIYVKRKATFRGDADGWMIIDIHKQSISTPISQLEFKRLYKNITTYSPDEAWRHLD